MGCICDQFSLVEGNKAGRSRQQLKIRSVTPPHLAHPTLNHQNEHSMDPVSLTTVIVALLDTARKVIRFLNEIKDAPSDRDKFLLEAQSSCILLWQLRDRLNAQDCAVHQPWFHHFTSLVAKDSILDQYQSSLTEVAARLEKLVNKRRFQSFRLTLAWKTEKADIEEIFQKIERCKSTIAIALSNDAL